MAIPRSWDENAPADNDFVSQYPANARSRRDAVKEIFGVDHVETEDSHQGKHAQVTLRDLAGDPAAAAGQGTLYAKTANGHVDLFYRDPDGDITRLTDQGNDFGTAARRDEGVASGDQIPDRAAADGRYARQSENLNDLTNASTARTNLGLGTAATVNTGTGAGDVPTTSQADTRYVNAGGDNMTGALVMDNATQIQGRGTGGTARRLINAGGDNTVRLGNSVFPLRIDSQDNPSVEINGTGGQKRLLIIDDLTDLQADALTASGLWVNTFATDWFSNHDTFLVSSQNGSRSTWRAPTFVDGGATVGDQITNHVYMDNTFGQSVDVHISMLLQQNTDDPGAQTRLLEDGSVVQTVNLSAGFAQQMVNFSARTIANGSRKRWGFEAQLASGSGTDEYRLLAVFAKVSF